eukprot:TRINITY_DN6594_c0_g1_i1.p1 TRINITY_DN6594_c0_g1~~TRINITY_DN6594_c0_g1_i1.p1  ORF type:complete len:491 (-),score=85.12 TRINITY_DN6594_c0_g1_i1:37-1509(-)
MFGVCVMTALAAAAVMDLALAATIARSPRHESLAFVKTHMFRKDCGRNHNPGAGMNPLTAWGDSATVYKDGFYDVDCVNDYMFAHGDKFGDKKSGYQLGNANVSIVHYTAHVPRADRQPMTHEVCFRFCRTVEDMAFFGLINGRECYCLPYFQADAWDNSMCDVVCDGDATTMCGGKFKSSIFGMHLCNDAKDDLHTAKHTLEISAASMRNLSALVATAGSDMQALADKYQPLFESAGDPRAADLMQSAKQFAGKLIEGVSLAELIKDDIAKLKSEEQVRSAGDPAIIKDHIAKIDAAKVQADVASDKLSWLMNRAIPDEEANAAKSYYPAMYFVDKQHASVPSTCTGTQAADPMVASSVDSCAHACDSDVGVCEAFSFFPGNGSSRGLCFLMSKLKTVTFFTGCSESSTGVGGDDAAPSSDSGDVKAAVTEFLQRTVMSTRAKSTADAAGVVCAVKFSKYVGTTLSPDATGKCKKCLKEAHRADRCVSV